MMAILARISNGVVLAILSFALSGCATQQNSSRTNYSMGERVVLGPLTYDVIETVWRNQLGDALNLRIPDQRFLLISVSVSNSGGSPVSVPLLTLENQNGQSFRELENGEGVDNWFGILRTIDPAQTQQGRTLFDVPLSSYRLRLTDGAESGYEKYAWVDIPLRIDTDQGVEAPTPGALPK